MSLAQYILDAREQYRLEIRERNTWLSRLRWYYLVVLVMVAIATSTLTKENAMRNKQIAITALCVGLVVNLILWALTKPKNRPLLHYQVIAVAQILLDVTLAAGVVYLQFGLASRATVLFAIPIAGAGLLFGQGFAFFAAILSSVGYSLALFMYQHNNPRVYALHSITLPAIFYTAVFFTIAVVVSSYSNRNASDEREKSYTEVLALLRHQLYHPTGVSAAIIDMLEHSEHYSKWPTKDKNYLHQLKYENKRQHTMIENLLKSLTGTDNKSELKQKEVFDVVAMLNDESISCATGVNRIADLVSRIPNKVIKIEGDKEQLSTAFSNVISNAFSYTDKGTQVIISATDENDLVTISIHDKGKGISEEDQRAIFKLFSKMQSRISDDPKKLYDSGLGLYVSKLIIERHEGSLEISSSAEYGTNVTITLHKQLT
ncbi:MAG TPA: ATP-binding protein [Candidatus Saccharimonadales bacterium]|nr:ATP-binding protein [Candidatus Saccharimonadales bacterium]